jgi:hypothetical protein
MFFNAVVSPEVDVRIRAEFEGIVAGDFVPPEDWKRAVSPAGGRNLKNQPKRRVNWHHRAFSE